MFYGVELEVVPTLELNHNLTKGIVKPLFQTIIVLVWKVCVYPIEMYLLMYRNYHYHHRCLIMYLTTPIQLICSSVAYREGYDYRYVPNYLNVLMRA